MYVIPYRLDLREEKFTISLADAFSDILNAFSNAQTILILFDSSFIFKLYKIENFSVNRGV